MKKSHSQSPVGLKKTETAVAASTFRNEVKTIYLKLKEQMVIKPTMSATFRGCVAVFPAERVSLMSGQHEDRKANGRGGENGGRKEN